MDKTLLYIIKDWKDEAGIKGIIQINALPTVRDILIICTAYPGYMIGKGGCLVDKYKRIIQKEFPNIKKIEFIETNRWWIK